MKKPGLTALICGLIVLSLALTLLPLASPAKAETLGGWTATTDYPSSTIGGSCAISGGYIYCVGGAVVNLPDNHVYFAVISSGGVAAWTNTTAYPTHVYLPSCVISGGFITCVGGLTAPGTEGNATYSASVSPSGVGSWTAESGYPTDIEATSCVTSGGFITCVGGLTGIGVNTAAVYSASLSSGTIGTWTATTSYPGATEGESCVASSGFITCLGGQFNPVVSNDINDSVYYNTLSSGSVGATWTASTPYPANVAYAPCNVAYGFIYCVGGYSGTGSTAVYYGGIALGAVASWNSTASYPTPVVADQCATSGAYIYCVGGQTDAVYYSLIGGSLIPTTTTVRCLPSSISTSVISTCTATVNVEVPLQTAVSPLGIPDLPTGTITWTQDSDNGGEVSFSSPTCNIMTPGFGQVPAPQTPAEFFCSVDATGEVNGTVTITGTYSGNLNDRASAGVDVVNVGALSTPPAFNPCELGESCNTAFVQFTGSGTIPVNASVKISGSSIPTTISNTATTLRYPNETVMVPTWFPVTIGRPIDYVVTLVNGTELSGMVTATVPWSVYNVNI